MSFKKSFVGLIFGATVLTANASSVSGTLSDDSARLDISYTIYEPVAVQAGGVYVSDRGKSGYLGVMVESKADPIELSLGARGRVVEAEFGDNDSGYSLGIGFQYRYIFPQANRISFYASAFYYPQLFSYENVKRQHEVEMRLEYAITETVRIHFAYNLNAVEYNSADSIGKEADDPETTFRLDEGANLGVGVYF